MIEFNVNDYLSVKLTDAGRAQHRADFERWATPSMEYHAPTECLRGWSRWQVWELMQIFGPAMFMGCPIPFETTVRLHTKGTA